MGIKMPDIVKLIIARVVASIAAPFFVWLAAKFNIIFTNDEQAQIVTETISWVIMFILLGYSLFHTWINSHFNPSDASTRDLLNKGKQQQDVINDAKR
jgi:hypothetical protein